MQYPQQPKSVPQPTDMEDLRPNRAHEAYTQGYEQGRTDGIKHQRKVYKKRTQQQKRKSADRDQANRARSVPPQRSVTSRSHQAKKQPRNRLGQFAHRVGQVLDGTYARRRKAQAAQHRKRVRVATFGYDSPTTLKPKRIVRKKTGVQRQQAQQQQRSGLLGLGFLGL